MSEVTEVKAIVDGGQASAGPPLGPSLGPLGVNVREVINKINEVTTSFDGMKVPIVVKVSPDRTFEIEVKTPTTSALILKAAGVDQGASLHEDVVGNITFKDAIEIATTKKDDMLAATLKTAVKEVVGSCLSCGISVDNKSPKEIFTDIEAGEYNSHF